jgi:hypothetical protein
MGLDVIVLGPKAVPAIDASDAVEGRRMPELQGEPHLHRNVAGSAPHATEVLAVVEDPGQERIGPDFAGDAG